MFTRNKAEPMWKGYMYACLMFATVFVQSMVLHQYFHRCFVVGMHIRTAVIAAVYKKVRLTICLRACVWCVVRRMRFDCLCGFFVEGGTLTV